MMEKLFNIIFKGFATLLMSFFMTLVVIFILTEYFGLTNNIEILMMLIMSTISVILYNNVPGIEV